MRCLKSVLKVLILAAVLGGLGASAPTPAQAHTLGIEVLGRSILYGVSYERSLAGLPWQTGIGLSRSAVESLEPGGQEPEFMLFPVYALGRISHRPDQAWLWSAGFTWLASTTPLQDRTSIYGGLRFASLPLILNAGLGYEWASVSGFLVRANLLIQLAKNIVPGLSLNLAYKL